MPVVICAFVLIEDKNSPDLISMIRSINAWLFLTAFIIRIVLVAYGEWQDHLWPALKYTDIDYAVFTDAARFIAHGKSPYLRSTYRYTPLLAWLMLPNIYIHAAFGKIVFCCADLLVGWILYRQGGRSASMMWLFNPFVIGISTRGNAESIMCMLTLVILMALQENKLKTAAIFYGIAVHFKIYPIIHALPILLHQGNQKYPIWRRIWSLRGLKFGLVSVLTFAICTACMYHM
jgi:phosphatidylinositol glycan class M